MKVLLRFFAVILIRYLQRKYKRMSISRKYRQSNQTLATLELIQSILYYFKCQFRAWGYFHPCCVWSEKDEKYFRKLFPQKDFDELDIVVWHNPEAVTYYHNKIYELQKNCSSNYAKEIKNQLIKWKEWN